MKSLKTIITALFLFAFSLPGSIHAEGELNVKKAEKLEIRHSMIGFRNTLIFYTFNEQRAVLRLSIDNDNETFPMTGKVYRFDKTTTKEGIKKWLNNQHSDGLYPEIPKPIFTAELPEEIFKVTSHKQTGVSKSIGHPPRDYKNFEIEFSVLRHEINEAFKLCAFTDKARVHVKKAAYRPKNGRIEATGSSIFK